MARWIPGRISKHRQRDPDTYEHVDGELIVARNSSLRKLMRAARREKLPEDRLFTISEAQKAAAKHADDYLSSHARAMKALRKAIELRAAE